MSDSPSMALLGWVDDLRPLPYLQLGDLFVRSVSKPVYVVISAGCDLQYVPEHVSLSRPRSRDDTVLLLPGELRPVNDKPKSTFNTGLIKYCDQWYAIDWHREKLISLAHCMIRKLLQDNEYMHSTRLRVSRAIELQQSVFHKSSQIGLDVQPPLSDELSIVVFAKKEEGVQQIGEKIGRGAVRFHTGRSESGQGAVVVIKDHAIEHLTQRLNEALNGEANKNLTLLKVAAESFRDVASQVGRMTMPAPNQNVTPVSLRRGVEKVKVKRVATIQGPIDSGALNMGKDYSIVLCMEEQ